MNKIVTGLLLLSTVVFGSLYFGSSGAVSEVQVKNPLNTELQAQVRGLESQNKILKQKNEDLKQQIAKLQELKADQKRVISTDPETGKKKIEVTSTDNNSSPFLKLLQDPKMQAMMKDRRKRMVEGRYGYLLSKLNISEEQKEALVELLGERAAVAMASGMKARMTQDEEERALINDEKEQAYAEADAKIADLLGDEYETYTDYKSKENEYREVDDINRSLGENKLDDDQKDQLATVMNQTNSSFQFSNEKVNESRWAVYSLSDEEKAQHVKEMEVRDEMILKESASFLNERQLEELKKEQAEDRERITRRRGGRGGRGGRF